MNSGIENQSNFTDLPQLKSFLDEQIAIAKEARLLLLQVINHSCAGETAVDGSRMQLGKINRREKELLIYRNIIIEALNTVDPKNFLLKKLLKLGGERRLQTLSQLIAGARKEAMNNISLADENILKQNIEKAFRERVSRAVVETLKRTLFVRDDGDTGPHSVAASEEMSNFLNAIEFSSDINKEIKDTYDMTPEEFKEWLVIGAVIHDVGKIGTPDAILLKPGRLSAGEFKEMKMHTVKGWELIREIAGDRDDKFIRMALDLVLYHHERYDGMGYPQRLKGKEIPISARLMSIIDSWDAATRDRVYKDKGKHGDIHKKKTKSPQDMITEFKEYVKKAKTEGASRYDPGLLELFVSWKEGELDNVQR